MYVLHGDGYFHEGHHRVFYFNPNNMNNLKFHNYKLDA